MCTSKCSSVTCHISGQKQFSTAQMLSVLAEIPFSTITNYLILVPFPFKRNEKLNHRWKYCKDLDIRLAFTSYNWSNMFSVKDRSQVVYKFTCVGFHACYIAETARHFETRVSWALNLGLQFPYLLTSSGFWVV